MLAGNCLRVLLLLALAASVLIFNAYLFRYCEERHFETTLAPLPMDQQVDNSSLVKYRDQLETLMNSLPHFKEQAKCEGSFRNFKASIRRSVRWRFDETDFWSNSMEGGSKRENFRNTCENIKEKFAFIEEPLSHEEQDYPLAYGLLVHEHAVQVYFMLSAIYQPQNVYYISVDGNSSSDFKTKMYLLDECFPNIYVVEVAPVEWCGYEIAQAVMNGLRHLAQLRHPWKYYQYLSGVDLPLKTNLEMVRITKKLNGSMNVHISPYMHERLTPSRKLGVKPPLRLIKSSLSAVISRETADAMFESELVREHMRFLKLTWCADESLWGTIIGNPEKLPIPGSFNPNKQLYKINHNAYHKMHRYSRRSMKKKVKPLEESSPATPSETLPNSDYIARYQAWYPNMPCHGKWTHGSCVFGVGDLPDLITREELFAHKLYIDVQPAAFFCLFERVRLRAIESAETVLTS